MPVRCPGSRNWGGRVGAWLADLLLFIFGFSAWWWCVLLVRSVWSGYRRLSQKFLLQQEPEAPHRHEGSIRAVGFVLLMSGSVGLEYLRLYTLKAQLPRAPGGVLGELIGGAAQSALGFTGATLLLLLLFGLGFSLFFHVSWLAVAERIGAALENAVLWLRNLYEARAGPHARHGGGGQARRRGGAGARQNGRGAADPDRAASGGGAEIGAGARRKSRRRCSVTCRTPTCRRCRCWTRRRRRRRPSASRRWNSPAA